MKTIIFTLLLISTYNSFSQDKRLFGKWKVTSVIGDDFYYNSIFFSDKFKEAFNGNSEIIKEVEELTRKTYSNAFYFFDEKGNHRQMSNTAKNDFKYSINYEKTSIKINEYENNFLMFEIPYRFENDILYLSLTQEMGTTNFELKRN